MAFLIECLIFAMQHSFKSSIEVYWSIIRQEEEQKKQLRALQSNKDFQKMMSALSIEAMQEENESERVQANLEVDRLKEFGPMFRSTLKSINESIEQMKTEFEEDHDIIDEYYSDKAKNRLNEIFTNLFKT
jgi:predicted  nucleic acid-binding Zn-ribbon protein